MKIFVFLHLALLESTGLKPLTDLLAAFGGDTYRNYFNFH